MSPRFSIETPPGPGAVGVVRVGSGDPDAVHRTLCCDPVGVGALAVRRVLGLDDALIARPDETTWLVMPHGGPALMRSIAAGLTDAGFESDPVDRDGSIESRMLHALSVAASPLAIDVLLDQPRRWSADPDAIDLADATTLNRLIDPPRVVAVGAPNIGKSSLLNALAGRSLAVAFDRSGTTRDAVGALIDARGLVIRWIDTPGVMSDDPETSRIVRDAVADADLVLRCFDASGDEPIDIAADTPSVRVALRSDRNSTAVPEGVIATSATTGAGLDRLTAEIRETLVPRSALDDPRPWRFWA